MPLKVVTVKAEKSGSAERQIEQLSKAKSDLEALLGKASKIVSVFPREDTSIIEFIAVVELPEEKKEEKKVETPIPHFSPPVKETPKKERK